MISVLLMIGNSGSSLLFMYVFLKFAQKKNGTKLSKINHYYSMNILYRDRAPSCSHRSYLLTNNYIVYT